MVQRLKIALYFTLARYFSFFARIRLRRWAPRVAILTGSNGKTVALHLAAVQLGQAAKYSFNANSAFGLPFDILGLKRKKFSIFEWPMLFLLAPFYALRGPHPEKFYIVEVDGDRPGDADFFGPFLRPEVCIWLSSGRPHSMLFEGEVRRGIFNNVDEAILYGFGRFLAYTSKLAIVNADNPRIVEHARRTDIALQEIKEEKMLEGYAVGISGTEFTIAGIPYRVPYMLPKETWYGLASSVMLAEYFGFRPTNDLSPLTLPPGRSSVLRGIKGTTIVDSSYNANVDSVVAIVNMVEGLDGEKCLILGDLIEQGALEEEEHERLPHILAAFIFKRFVLVGPRMRRYVKPILQESNKMVESFIGPKEALDHLQSTLHGNEILVFKGARFLEGIIEHLLADKSDAQKLCRREKVWQQRRKKWGL